MSSLEQQERSEKSMAQEIEEQDGEDLLKQTSTDAAAANGIPLTGLERQFTGSTLVDRTNLSPESPPETEGPQNEFPGFARRGVPAQGRIRKFSGVEAPNALPPSPQPSSDDAVDDEVLDPPKKLRHRMTSNPQSPPKRTQSSDIKTTLSDLQAVVADAFSELKKVQRKEQSARPLRIAKRRPSHHPDEALLEQFKQLADDELKIRRLNMRDWLRVATWWLLKARYNLENEEESDQFNSRASFSVKSEGNTAVNQAYVDLLKASWILHDIVLSEHENNLTSLITDDNRTLVLTLSEGINEEFSEFAPVDAPEKAVLLKQNIDIWEAMQPAEEAYEEEGAFPGMENERWVTVEQDHAGAEDETVLYRTFVDAEIGRKRIRKKTKGARYMLLLFLRVGESEPKITLCNQSGTMVLSRDLTIDDVQGQESFLNPLAGLKAESKHAVTLNFEKIEVVLVLNQRDLENFMYLPRAYFEAVKRREPRSLENATETLIFNRSLEVFEKLNASTLKPTNPREVYKSCDLRVLETTGKLGWRTTRRLVISSSAGEKPPWCEDHFLPLSRVQVRREGHTPTVTIKWSDCSQQKKIKDGNYGWIYSYVYNDANPNKALSLTFRNVQAATDFEMTVLHLPHGPLYSWDAGSTSAEIYTISDLEPNPKTYKGLLLTHTRSDWRYSELFYIYRDLDYLYDSIDRTAIKIKFPELYYTDYISNHVDRHYKPDLGDPLPSFSHCDKKSGNTHVSFNDESAAMQLLSALTSSHTLLFSRRCHYITTKPPSRFGGTKSNKGPAEVQLWQKGGLTRLTSRWDDKVEDRWMSMTLQKEDLDNKRDSNRASFPKLPFERGRKIDMANLTAKDPRDKKDDGKKTGPLTIAFDSVRGKSPSLNPLMSTLTIADREEFAAALERRVPVKTKSNIENLMDL